MTDDDLAKLGHDESAVIFDRCFAIATMSLLGNIIWLIFGGFFAGLGYIVGGLALCLTIVGIPFGLQTIKLGFATFAPFGKDIVVTRSADSLLALVLNVFWVLLFGWEIAIAHLISAFILAITIIGLPFAKQHLKLLVLAFLPFGRELR
ncbi:MAG: YccF domain-containing protein [Thermosynechococcaceae cyanobacterium]